MTSTWKYRANLESVATEIMKARKKFRPFVNAHEAYAVLSEEVEELWAVVKSKSDGTVKDRAKRIREEAMQVAAMAVCIMTEIVEDDDAKS